MRILVPLVLLAAFLAPSATATIWPPEDCYNAFAPPGPGERWPRWVHLCDGPEDDGVATVWIARGSGTTFGPLVFWAHFSMTSDVAPVASTDGARVVSETWTLDDGSRLTFAYADNPLSRDATGSVPASGGGRIADHDIVVWSYYPERG